ncbi:outer spore coat copper-dependent laccase CotA [Kineosporia mesophila]|uniref:Outer spore coat copper-dependent laccase CotA n=1 Tax=Kineosporia mesophila TaxID=566012 RepID=A0ABP7AP71_9ACTN|nr:multicopper oxidase domain-containing protein [Kineosporia mesophila]MCD5349384.1 multicopper oxidase domain-containing protein [Kineosporia mesophila]
MKVERRQFLRLAAALGLVPLVGVESGTAAPAAPALRAAAATRISGASYASKFRRALPRPPRVKLTKAGSKLTVDIVQFRQQVLTGFPTTKLYGYRVSGGQASWPGATIETQAGRSIKVTWRNKLPVGTRKISQTGGHLLPVDASLLDATTLALPAGQKPTVTHLHGGHTEWQSDGHPEAWTTQSGRRGKTWKKAVYTYDNSGRAGGTLWYHDHTHGITRLNVYAGMAGLYLLRDTTENSLITRHVLPATAYEREIVIQDRAFTDDGQLFMETDPPSSGGIKASVFFDFITVNGVPWPVLDVQQRKYRFRLVNGSDSRMYVLRLTGGASFLVVGNDQGLLRSAVATTSLLLAPGERYDVVIDFSKLKLGTTMTLRNAGIDGSLMGFTNAAGTVTNRPTGTSFGDGNPADTASTASIMRFRVSAKRSKVAEATVKAGTTLGRTLTFPKSTFTRRLIINRGSDGQGRDMEMLGTLEAGTLEWMDKATEIVPKGRTEVWEIYNTSLVAHPIHLHLVHFQILDRAPFTFTTMSMPMSDGGTGAMVDVTGRGTRRKPETYERGPKDTAVCYPGEVTRIIATFDRVGNYVWHCHELHHEDHDMMRPLLVR